MDYTQSDKAAGVVLMKDGKWQVPPEERPRGWEKILTDVLEPTQEQVAQCVGEVSEATKSATAEIQEPQEQKRWLDPSWLEIRTAIIDSGNAYGADRGLIESALLLAAGMWARDNPTLRKMLGRCGPILAKIERCYSLELWPQGEMLVRLGDFDKHGDLAFWLNAMAVNGDIRLNHDGTFSSLDAPPLAREVRG